MLTVAVVLLALIFFSLWFGLFQIVKQQGRILLRLDDLEKRLEVSRQPVITTGVQLQPQQPAGLPVGTQVHSFNLPDLDGNMVSLDQFRGKQVLMIHWNPGCGFCDMITADLAGLQKDLKKQNVELLLMSYGSVDSNRKLLDDHSLKCSVLLLDETKPLKEFLNQGTPVAYLLDEQGRTAEPIAVGAELVPELARLAATSTEKRKGLSTERPLSESKIARDGLKAGTVAPAFRLPNVHGGEVSLTDYLGKKVLLVFTDPHCGPCEELAPELARLDQQHRNNGLALLLVGRGELSENRQKAQTHGFKFPVVVQDQWKLSKQYGIFATPVGFLIDEKGVIEKDVAVGNEQILALVENAVTA